MSGCHSCVPAPFWAGSKDMNLCFLASLWELKHAGQEGSFDQVLSFHSCVRKMPRHVVGHVCPVT